MITPHPPGAKYTGFYGVNGATIQSIQVTCAGGCDGFALGEFALAPTPVDLSISMSGPEQVFAGEDLTYTIPVTNTGATPAYAVKVTFPLHSMSYLSANYTCNQSLDTLTCNLGDLPGGTRRDLTVLLQPGTSYVTEDPDASILVSNQAQTSCSNLDNNPDNNLSNFVNTLITEQADLKVSTYSIPDTSVRAGELLTYTIHTDNLGPSTARNVVVSDTLLSNPNFQIESCSFSTTQGSGTLTQPSCAGTFVTFPDSPDMSVFTTSQLRPPGPGTSGRLIASFVLRALTDLDASNTTQAYADTPDPETSNNTITGSISVSAVADLSVTMTATIPSLPAGGQADFQVEVTNHGPSKAENILLNDFIPTGLVSGTIQVSGLPAGSCTAGTPGDPADPLICQVGDLDKDGSNSFQYPGSDRPGLLRRPARPHSGEPGGGQLGYFR